MTYADLEAQPVQVHKSWPATVTLPNGDVLTPALVLATREYLYVWTARGEPTIALRYAELQLRGTFDPPSVPNRATLEHDSSAVSWVSAPGCGCSHDLKRYSPLATTGPRRLG